MILTTGLSAHAVDFDKLIDQAKAEQTGTATDIAGNLEIRSQHESITAQKRIKIEMIGQAIRFSVQPTPEIVDLHATPNQAPATETPDIPPQSRGIASVTAGK